MAGASSDQIIGKDLTSPPFRINPPDPVWVAGATQGQAKRLNLDNEAAGYGPNAGIVFGVGRHRVTFFVKDIIVNTRSVKVRVGNVTDGTETVVNTYTSRVPNTIVMEWTGVAGKAYQPMIGILTYTGAAGVNGYLDILRIRYEFVPFLSVDEAFRSDPGPRYVSERLDSALALVDSANATGDLPFTSDRGLNFLSFRTDEIPLTYYLDRQNKKVRTALVSFAYRPGFYEL
jgi:hypothetical protein